MNLFRHSDKIYKIRTAIILLCLSVLLVSCCVPGPVKHSAPCIPQFPDQDGWYGGDGAYSIDLDGQRSLWLFGDTFASEEKGRKNRIGMDVILGNTLAVSTCSTDQKFFIRYFLKKEKGAFVSSFGKDEWLWPQDPFIAENVLYIPLLVIQPLPGEKALFSFKIAGHKIARIKDYSAGDPHTWPVDYLDWTDALASGIEALATTSVVHEGFVYFYPLYRHTGDNLNIYGNILARLSVGHLGNPAHHFEYWTSDGWQKELKPAKVKLMFPVGVSELSVRYSARDKEWLAVYLSPENKGHQLLYATARNPEGPWRPPSVLIPAIAEVDPGNPLYDQHTFCYAGKEHRQFAQNKTLIVTYVCNSAEDIGNQESFLRKNLFLYRPRVKAVRR